MHRMVQGGGRRIRTYGPPKADTAFREQHHQPLGHPSTSFRSIQERSFKMHYLFFKECILKVLAAHELATAPNLASGYQMSTGHPTFGRRPLGHPSPPEAGPPWAGPASCYFLFYNKI